MHLATFLTILLFQAPNAGPAAATGGAGPAEAAAQGGMPCAVQGGLMAVMLLVMYFVMIRPENKRRQEVEDTQKALRKGAKVRTTGGILGEIVSIDEREAVLEVSPKVRINVLRGNIAGLEGAAKPEEKKADEKAAEKAAEKS
jgi:preprotein translocase subunit YajC